MAGREYMGILRSTFLIDPQGIIREVWDNVKVKAHADRVHKTLCQRT
jgi:peroxiredoxin Q/BCP